MKTQLKTVIIGLLIVLLIGQIPTTTAGAAGNPDPIPTPVLPARAPDGQLMIGWHEQGDNMNTLKANERALGKRFAIVRTYHQWTLPGRRIDDLVKEGRLNFVSHKPPSPGRGGWKAVASGREDRMIRSLAQKYRGYGRQVLFTFHHEPHDDASDVKRGGRYGTSAQYRAAWQRIHDIFVAEKAAATAGGNVYFTYVATSDWMLRGTPAGSADTMYPGDDRVDVFGHDKYNWASCHDKKWIEFEAMWSPILDLAAARRKPVIPGEWGSPPAGGRRNEWFRNAARFMKSDPRARQWMLGFAYFHSFHDNCHWDFMKQGRDGKDGWIETFSSDPYFVGAPFALPDVRSTSAPTPAPAPEPEPTAAPEPPESWTRRTRQPGGLPKGSGEMSGLASSRRHPGLVWGVRDSGNPASLYALRQHDDQPGKFSMREVKVAGAKNRDWEDLVYGEENGRGVLYIVDTGAKVVYKVAEPDPGAGGKATVLDRYRYAFPDASPSGTCGPRHNVEAAFLHPPLTGRLHLVRKMRSPAGVYRFDRLSGSATNVPKLIGRLADASCISVAAISLDGRGLVTASHDTLRLRRGDGSVESLLRSPPGYRASVSPDNNEAGSFFPFGSNNFLLGAENRSTWTFQ